jgi:zinc transport system substrate-binding protein
MRYLLVAVALGLACTPRNESRVRVVASTADIAAIVAEVGRNRFAVTTIAPAGLCPGHFDLRPSDITASNQARLLLNHGWEEWYPSLAKALLSPGPRRVTLQTRGNWMIPDIHKQATGEIVELLCAVDAARADSFRGRSQRYQARIDSAAAALKSRFRAESLPAVIAADKQAPFLAWLGFRVAATYGRPEDMTAQELVRLSRAARDSGVRLFVDNLQSGPEAGLELARATNARHVLLSNFPLEGGYLATLAANADSLLAALK